MKVDLDHVAIAQHDATETLRSLVGEFGARPLFGGVNFGFRAMQVDAGDMRIELLEPHNVHLNDFLARFLAANGEGPHHLTFKTDDIVGLLKVLEGAGYTPVGVNIDNPFWREAFIHPKQANGTVVQVAESDLDPLNIDPALIPEEHRDQRPAAWWSETPEPAADRALLRRVVVTTEEYSKTVALYRDLLQGQTGVWDEGFVELGWPGGGKIRIEVAAGRREGIDRLEWDRDGPSTERILSGTKLVF